MTLREMRAALDGMIGDTGNGRLGWGEKVQYLNWGQNFFEGQIYDVEKDKWLVRRFITAVDGTATYAVQNDVREIAVVIFNGVVCNQIALAELQAISFNSDFRPVYGQYHFWSEAGNDSVGQAQITIYPTPVTAYGLGSTSIEVWYYKKTTELHERGIYNGSVTTAAGSQSAWIDINAPFYGSGLDFWGLNSQVRWTSGNQIHMRGSVISFTPATGGFTSDTTLNNILINTTYELDQVCPLPQQYHHLVVLYAADLASRKLGNQSGIYKRQYMRELEMMRRKWEQNVSPALPGQNWGNVNPFQQAVAR